MRFALAELQAGSIPLTDEEGGLHEAKRLSIADKDRQLRALQSRIQALERPLTPGAAIIVAAEAGRQAASRGVQPSQNPIVDVLVRRQLGLRIGRAIVPGLLRWQVSYLGSISSSRSSSRPRTRSRAARAVRRVRRRARSPGSLADPDEPGPPRGRLLARAGVPFAGAAA